MDRANDLMPGQMTPYFYKAVLVLSRERDDLPKAVIESSKLLEMAF